MKVLLLGLGRANIAVARYLMKSDAELDLYEEYPERLSREASELIRTGRIGRYDAGGAYELVVTSPGFPDRKEIITALRNRSLRIIDEIEFTYGHLGDPDVIAVTGTNGKSTTAALISSILSASGVRNFLGGNIAPGTPFSQALFEPRYDYYVLEVSSFQLMRIERFRPRVAVLTNIDADHLNWHRDFEEYVTAKGRLFANQGHDDHAVLNRDDPRVARIEAGIRSRVTGFGRRVRDGVWLNGRFNYRDERLFALERLGLIGEHNRFNAAAAIAVGKILGVANDAIEAGIRQFRPLPHRLESLGVIGGITYINNSMCTNEAAAIASLAAVAGTKIVIAGGRSKGDRAEKYLDRLGVEAKACVLLGDNASEIAQYLQRKGYNRIAIARDMEDAVIKARVFAAPGDVIILNPGFASFGLFRDFAERGEAFKNAVAKNR